MAKVTIVFAALLIALGLIGYVGTGSQHPTALIPAWIGVALGLFGFLAISPSEGRRKLFMHVNVTIGLLAFLGGAVEAVRGYVHAKSMGAVPDPIALASKATMAGLMLIYVILCVRSFIDARRTGKV
jgi:nitrate/nitrite transporter NarK